MLPYTITRFIYDKIFISLIMALVIGIAVSILWGLHVLLSFISGYAVGCIYFLMLSLSASFMLSRSKSKVRKVFFPIFAARYLIIALILISLIKFTHINIFAMIAGLTVVNIAIVISAFIKKAAFGGGGKYGRD